ncbi:HS12B-like protein [Mya arenaria]|uniref:HS12B-like protein n=1 Tax=Mya arenaria TaxID=6604 RepID=A0ABY7FWC0_MYAAR|nr:HS12B-like protein [Mya arenaria]
MYIDKATKSTNLFEARPQNSEVKQGSWSRIAPLLVAAIDFGTTYSGWSYSFKHEFELDPTKASTKRWHGDQLVSLKAPTCVLIEPDGETFSAFGYDAETKYTRLAGAEKLE